MKKIIPTLSILAAFLLGCSSTNEKQHMLSAAGFKAIPANSPQRVEHLNSLPDNTLTTANLNGHHYFIFPDRSENILLVGQEPQYQRYQKMRLENDLPVDQATTAQITDDWTGWGSWGRW